MITYKYYNENMEINEIKFSNIKEFLNYYKKEEKIDFKNLISINDKEIIIVKPEWNINGKITDKEPSAIEKVMFPIKVEKLIINNEDKYIEIKNEILKEYINQKEKKQIESNELEIMNIFTGLANSIGFEATEKNLESIKEKIIEVDANKNEESSKKIEDIKKPNDVDKVISNIKKMRNEEQNLNKKNKPK